MPSFVEEWMDYIPNERSAAQRLKALAKRGLLEDSQRLFEDSQGRRLSPDECDAAARRVTDVRVFAAAKNRVSPRTVSS